MTDRRVIPIATRASDRLAKITGTQPAEQPKPAPAVAPRNLDSPRRYELLLQLPGFWKGAEQTRLELAGRPGWQAPTLQRSLDVKLHRADGAAVLEADRQAVAMVDALGEDRLRQLRVATEHFHKAKELERGR